MPILLLPLLVGNAIPKVTIASRSRTTPTTRMGFVVGLVYAAGAISNDLVKRGIEPPR